MNTEKIDELAKALNAFQAEVVTVGKDADNPFFKSKYAPLDSIMRTALPVLTKHGLAVSQLIDNIDGASALTTTLIHTSGQSISSTMPLLLTKSDPQGQGSAITYARRYSYASILGIVIDEDDDGNRASPPASTATDSTKAQTAPADGALVSEQQGKMLLAKARSITGFDSWDDVIKWFEETIGCRPQEVKRGDVDAVIATMEEARQ